MKEEFTGPLTPSADELPAVIALANRVFRVQRPGDMAAEYPVLFNGEHLEHLRVMKKGDQVVSLVGMVLDDTSLLGCDVRVASIGSVCTDPDCRGHGLAGRLMDDAIERAKAAGASLMLISGNRTLYARRGAFGEGRFWRYEIPVSSLPEPTGRLEVLPVAADDCGEALRLFEAEPIRFRRTPQRYAVQIACGYVQDRPGRTYVVRANGEPLAAFSVCKLGPPKDAEGTWGMLIVEAAGSRSVLLEAVRSAAQELHVESVEIDAYVTDLAMRDACARVGAAGKIIGFHGTFKLLDAARLWTSFLPLISERIGIEFCEQIKLTAEADELKVHTLTFELAGQSVKIEGAREILAALFGSPQLDALAPLTGRLADLLRKALPLPLPLYGMSYI